MSNITPYTDLITSEHNQRPNYMAMIAATIQPLADNLDALQLIIDSFDLDIAVGQQLDIIGLWVGISRNVSVPLAGVYFSFDVVGQGLDESVWLGPYDPISGLVTLLDDSYRTLIRMKIAANHWDGTVPSAEAIWAIVFAPQGITIVIVDNQDMSMTVIVYGALDAVTKSLLTNGYFQLKPAGVRITGYETPSIVGMPIFGLDMNSSVMAGLDQSCWSVSI